MLEILNPIIEALFYLLRFFHGISGNWGVAIVLLTVLVRIILLPLTIKQTRSMKAMQDLQPKLMALRERYKDDKERMAQEMMKFYKDNKVNPMSGCLPMLPQIPIMLSLFYLLQNTQINEGVLKGAGFLWIGNLTAPHDIPLVVLMGVTQLISMLMVTKDPQQKKIMIPFVIILPIITLNLPAGVVLYWVTMNVWIIGQQYVQFRAPTVATAGPSAPEPEVKVKQGPEEKKATGKSGAGSGRSEETPASQRQKKKRRG